MELKKKILEATLFEFNEKNFKFKMDDIAKRIGISKKTIYVLFESKESLFFETVDYCFEEIKKSEQKIVEDKNLDIIEKIKKIMIVLPDKYKSMDLRQVYIMEQTFPKVYEKIKDRVENQWEPTIELLEQGIKENKIKPISIPILKTMVQSTIESFLTSKVLIENNMNYEEGLKEMIDILMDGIQVK